MPTYTIKPGESALSVCAQNGFSDVDKVWSRSENKSLREKRSDPGILAPGDALFVPDKQVKSFSIGTGATHQFVVKPMAFHLHLKLKDSDGKAVAGEEYELQYGFESASGKTDHDGVLDVKLLGRPSSAVLHIQGRILELAFHHLRPLNADGEHGIAGAQGRLQNLGYDPGPLDGILGPRTRAAVRIFQLDHGLDATGELDDKTIDRLTKEHGR